METHDGSKYCNRMWLLLALKKEARITFLMANCDSMDEYFYGFLLEVGLAGLIISTSGNWWNYICPGYPAFYSHHILGPLWSCSPQMTWCFKTCNSYYYGKLILKITSLGHYFWQRRTQNDFSVSMTTSTGMEQESFYTTATLCS